MTETPEEPITKKKTSGTGNINLPVSVVSPNDPERPENTMAITALRRARMYEAAMASLIEAQSALYIPIAHLAGFAVELGLKAYLLLHLCCEHEVKAIGHDLIKAWKKAREAGLEIPEARPDWLNNLDRLHKSMLLRYPHRTTGGLVIPNQSVYRQGIAELLSAVERHVEK